MIRYSEVDYLAQCVFYAIRWRSLKVIKSGLWLVREHRRRGVPGHTFRELMALRRRIRQRREYLRHWPRQGEWPT